MEKIDPRKYIRGTTYEITLLDTESETDEIDLGREFAIIKIAPIDSTGIASGATIELLLNGRPVFVNNNQITLTFPDEDFVWFAVPVGGGRKVSLRFSAVATADVVFQVTGYEQATDE